MNKRLFGTLLFLAVALCAFAGTKDFARRIPANSGDVSYTGRVERQDDGTVRFDWTGTYFQTDFTGGNLAVEISEKEKNFYNLWLDGRWIKKIKVEGQKPQQVVLAKNLSAGVHRVMLQRCTEGNCGTTTLHAFLIAGKGSLKPVAPRKRFIEVYGDSYTCGYGDEAPKATDPFTAETENCDKAYACILARYFDADYALIAHSGQGMARNYGEKGGASQKNQFTRSSQLFDETGEEPYDFKAYKPDLVMINLGTNDFSSGKSPDLNVYWGNYRKLIEKVKQEYGEELPVLCIVPHSANSRLLAALDSLRSIVKNYRKVIVSNPMPNAVKVPEELGASYHPNYIGQRKIAMTLIPVVSCITGWPLEDKTVK